MQRRRARSARVRQTRDRGAPRFIRGATSAGRGVRGGVAPSLKNLGGHFGAPNLLPFERAEEVRNLERRGLRRVRAVYGVGLDRARELLADGAGGGLGGVGGAHEITPLLNGVVGLEHHRDARPLRPATLSSSPPPFLCRPR